MSKSLFADDTFVKELSPNNFNRYQTWKLRSKECSIVLFYCPWCPHCVKLKNLWNKLAVMAAFFNVYAFNCEKYKEHELKIKEENPTLIQGYPTILIYEEGIPIRRINETERELDILIGILVDTCSYSNKNL